MHKIQISRSAGRDIREAALWYNEQQPGLGRRFTHSVRGKLKLISKNPRLYELRYANVRVAILPIFPFAIHFRIDSAKKTVGIFGIFHTSVNPEKWQSRKE
ncbi:type II toxin-antitoxin system RelE/ParE family toxin [Dyadobacter sp. CY343]|uniref:type II toxin-antitoxin system RelE/ParE family toxin n=1 Tax=Dyadobacter sp. CY343 TaxID=2907299 RepID=UPI0038D3B6B6